MNRERRQELDSIIDDAYGIKMRIEALAEKEENASNGVPDNDVIAGNAEILREAGVKVQELITWELNTIEGGE